MYEKQRARCRGCRVTRQAILNLLLLTNACMLSKITHWDRVKLAFYVQNKNKVRVMMGLCAKKVFLNKTKPKDHSFCFTSGQWGHTEPGHQLNPGLHIMCWIPAPANFKTRTLWKNTAQHQCYNTAKVRTEETMNPEHPAKWGVVRCHLPLCKKLSEAVGWNLTKKVQGWPRPPGRPTGDSTPCTI